VSIGANHSCEHFNKLMNFHAGLNGTSNNPNTRQQLFFLATPELSSLANEFKDQFHAAGSKEVEHYDFSPSTVK